MDALIDTGASRSFVSAQFARQCGMVQQEHEPLVVKLPTGKRLEASSVVELNMLMDNVILEHVAYVLDITEPMILGSDFFEKYGVVLDLAQGTA